MAHGLGGYGAFVEQTPLPEYSITPFLHSLSLPDPEDLIVELGELFEVGAYDLGLYH